MWGEPKKNFDDYSKRFDNRRNQESSLQITVDTESGSLLRVCVDHEISRRSKISLKRLPHSSQLKVGHGGKRVRR